MKLKLTIISIFIALCVVMFACKDENTATPVEKADIVLSPFLDYFLLLILK